MTDTRDPAHWHKLAEDARAGRLHIAGRPHIEPHRAECANCYGNGCSSCAYRGTVETEAGREAREAHEDGAYDRWRDDRLTGDR